MGPEQAQAQVQAQVQAQAREPEQALRESERALPAQKLQERSGLRAFAQARATMRCRRSGQGTAQARQAEPEQE
jgi:hypothetical protein